METNLAINPARILFNRNVDLQLAIHCALALETSPEIMMFMGNLLASPFT